MNGYKSMISDHIPQTWDLALRWCKCRTAWIDYIYNSYIKPYNNNVMSSDKENKRQKSLAVKKYTGHIKVKEFGRTIKFKETIKLDSLLVHDVEQWVIWNAVDEWVKWFADTGDYIANSADIYLHCKGLSVEQTAQALSKRYGVDIKLVEFIIKNNKLC